MAVANGLLVGVATVAGAGLARRHAARRELCFGAAAGGLLVIAGVHLLPDAWSAARQAGSAPAWVPVIAVATYALAGLAVRYGCACRADCEAAGGAWAAAALTAHRMLEGAVLAIAGSVTITAALTVHALAEGLAAGTLLTASARRVGWLLALCVSPMAGAALAGVWRYPAAAQPVLLAVMAGVLGRAAWVSLAAAFRSATPVRLAAASPAAAALVSAAITVVAVHAAG
jgi:hypothetical protein